jgi:hypothetical protein
MQLQINDNTTGTKKNLNSFYVFVDRANLSPAFWGKAVDYSLKYANFRHIITIYNICEFLFCTVLFLKVGKQFSKIEVLTRDHQDHH